MQRWQTTYLGMRELPREISTFEMQAFSLSGLPNARFEVGRSRYAE